MSTVMSPYLNFDGNAREAMTFYQEVFGGQLDLVTFAQFGFAEAPADGIMHASLTTDSGFVLMASDTMPDHPRVLGDAISVSLAGEDAPSLREYWSRLSDGANVVMPLERQVWGDEYGQLVDRYGVPWMININGAQA